MSAKKPEIDLARVEKLQRELADLQSKFAKLGGKEAKKSGEVLGAVAKLARELAVAGEGGLQDSEARKAELKNQAKKVQDLIKGLGPKRS